MVVAVRVDVEVGRRSWRLNSGRVPPTASHPDAADTRNAADRRCGVSR